ncbi:hypothetical protein ES708_10854 [subsurface metagenome]|jgi:excisionase family DNA binding protein
MVQTPFAITDPLPVGKAAKHLAVSRWTLYRWIRQGKIIAIQFGGILFIPQPEIERFQNQRQPNAKQ